MSSIEYAAPDIGIRITDPLPLFSIGTTRAVTVLTDTEQVHPCTEIVDDPTMPWFCFSMHPRAGRPLRYLIQAHERGDITLCVLEEEADDSYIEALRAMYL